MAEEEVVLGPAKEVLDEREKVEVPEREREQEVRAQRASPARRVRALRSLSVPQLISLYNDDSAANAFNEEARQQILEVIMEKGGPGAVRRALGRLMAMADGHTGPPDERPGSGEPDEGAAPPGGDEAGAQLGILRTLLGEAFVASLLRTLPATSAPSRDGPGLAPTEEQTFQRIVSDLRAAVRLSGEQ